MKSLPYVAAAYIAFLTTWTLSLLGPPLRAGIFDINASPLNFLSIRLTSPLNGHQYIVTLESTRYCFISTNATVSLSAIGVQPGNGGGLFQWIAGKVIKSQLPEPSTLKTGCWQWSHRLFETLESSDLFQALQYITLALAVLGSFMCIYYLVYSRNSITEDDEDQLSNDSDDTNSYTVDRTQAVRLTAISTLTFLVTLASMIAKCMLFFGIANAPALSVESTDAAPYVSPSSAAKPSKLSYVYIITGRTIGPAFVLALISCIIMFTLLNVLYLVTLPQARRCSSTTDEEQQRQSSTPSPFGSLNRQGSGFALNEEIRFSTPEIEERSFWENVKLKLSLWWLSIRLGTVRILRRLSGRPVRSSGTMSAKKKRVRIVEPQREQYK